MDKKWVKILETIKEDEILEYLKQEFDKNNIKYKIELEEKWEGIRIPKYIGKFVVYIQKEFINKAEKILNSYYKNTEITMGENSDCKDIDDELEKESKKIAKKQKNIVKIYLIILACMIISIIVAGTIG